MEPNQPADQKFCAVFASFIDGLVEKKSIADGTVQHAVENMSKSFSLVKKVMILLGRRNPSVMTIEYLLLSYEIWQSFLWQNFCGRRPQKCAGPLGDGYRCGQQ